MRAGFRLPPDLERSLRDGTPRELDAGPYGVLEVVPFEALRLETLEVRCAGLPHPGAEEDPHDHDYGFHAVPAVNLVRGSRRDDSGIDPSRRFVWLPEERRLGSYDEGHGEVALFDPGLTWAEIRAEPERFAGAAEVAGIERVPMEFLRPCTRHPYVPDPPDPEFDA